MFSKTVLYKIIKKEPLFYNCPQLTKVWKKKKLGIFIPRGMVKTNNDHNIV